jgi:23S rRNA (cytosine1962-C5)-methyltransferase
MAWAEALERVPGPEAQRIGLRVSPAAERSVRGGHPWLFDGAITDANREGKPGDLAVVFDRKRRFLAIGLFDPTAPIRVRILHHGTPCTIDADFFARRIQAAVARRAPLAATAEQPSGTNGYRLLHGENDGLPGLVVDRYADTLVLRLDTPAWLPHLPSVLPALVKAQPAASMVLRMTRSVAAQPAWLYGLEDGMALLGAVPDAPVRFRENGLVFEADTVHGQKTGFFLDQRDNRQRVGELAHGRRVLNVFAYNGGFSLYAARGGAPEVTSLDISAGALAAAERNFAHNRHIAAVAAARHHTLAADAFDALAQLRRDGRRYEMVIVDPPAFAKRQSEVDNALSAYARLAELGLGVLAPGGMLVMASCSSRVPADRFFATINAAAYDAGRPLKEHMRTEHAIDHPVSFPEGAYLKCLFGETEA